MWHERLDFVDNVQLNFEDITGFYKEIIFKIRWSNRYFIKT